MTSGTRGNDILLTPIGYIKNSIKTPSFKPDGNIDPEDRKRQIRKRRKEIKESISELNIDPAYNDLLDGIDGFSHILVLFWPHLLTEKDRELKTVHPMGRKDLPAQGIFATRSPARPNPVLVTVGRLLERKKNMLFVQGLDSLDGSPILDIKPIIREHEGIENPKFPDWVKEIHKDH